MISQVQRLPTTPSFVLEPGATVGHYIIESVIGEGGMGLVFRARHVDLDMKVAIKTIRPELAADDRLVARLMDEARAVASLRSDHVVRVFDVARMPDGAPYLVLELVDGPDLDRVLSAGGPMSVDEAVATMLDVCLGLAEAHRRGIVHRDIKPENLLVEQNEDGTSRVKISDFGIAKRSVSHKEMSLTQQSGSVGSPWYMAPEQMINARDIDPRADVWSVGVVLFELLTGAVPFPGEDPAEVCARVMSLPPLPVRQIRPDVPEALEAIITRCLRREREQRFPDVAELALALVDVVPSLHAKARAIGAKLGAIDVVLGRTLASVAAVKPEADLSATTIPIPRVAVATIEDDVRPSLSSVPGVRKRWPYGAIAAAVMAAALFIAFHRHDVRSWAHARIDALVGARAATGNVAIVPVVASTARAARTSTTVTDAVSRSVAAPAPSVAPTQEQLPPLVALPLLVVPKASRTAMSRGRQPASRDYYVPPDAPFEEPAAAAAAPVAHTTTAPAAPSAAEPAAPADEIARMDDRASTPVEPFAEATTASAAE